ncbi:hypothetical protein ABPG77_011430 [Micractinium sp. CCAP 211/92]
MPSPSRAPPRLIIAAMCTLAPWTIGADSPPASDFILDIEQGSQSAISLLKKLSSDKTPIAGQKIPQRELQQCAGLAFTFVKKAGAVISVDAGSGFVLAKIKGADGSTSWSAPLFISVYSAGLGLTLGASAIDTVTVLDTPEAVARYARSQWDMSADVTAAGPLGKIAGHDNVSELALGEETFSYSTAAGAIVDFSYKGMRYQLDVEKNKATYGAEATPKDILEGKVETPRPMLELQAALSKFASEGTI